MKIFVAAGAALCTLLAPAATAVASTTASGTVHGWHAITLPAGWQNMSAAQLAKYGIVPNMPGPDGEHVIVSATPLASPAVMQPDSHSGCSQDVCIDVYGSGLYVSSWDTYAHLGTGNCSYAVFNVNGQTLETGPEECGNTGYVYATGSLVNHYYNAGDQLCNAWPHEPGYPNTPGTACATIEP